MKIYEERTFSTKYLQNPEEGFTHSIPLMGMREGYVTDLSCPANSFLIRAMNNNKAKGKTFNVSYLEPFITIQTGRGENICRRSKEPNIIDPHGQPHFGLMLNKPEIMKMLKGFVTAKQTITRLTKYLPRYFAEDYDSEEEHISLLQALEEQVGPNDDYREETKYEVPEYDLRDSQTKFF